jgi:hypothetical protein
MGPPTEDGGPFALGIQASMLGRQLTCTEVAAGTWMTPGIDIWVTLCYNG